MKDLNLQTPGVVLSPSNRPFIVFGQEGDTKLLVNISFDGLKAPKGEAGYVLYLIVRFAAIGDPPEALGKARGGTVDGLTYRNKAAFPLVRGPVGTTRILQIVETEQVLERLQTFLQNLAGGMAVDCLDMLKMQVAECFVMFPRDEDHKRLFVLPGEQSV